MEKYFNYNILNYINSYKGEKSMIKIDNILSDFKICRKYQLNDQVLEYLHYIDEKPFYISPSFCDIKTNQKVSTLNPKFILFSAPGATGKSSLAKYIANRYNALYWNLAKVKIGTNSFAGSILNAVGARNYSNFINDLNTANSLLVIDAFDEAEIISGRKMLSSFVMEINNSLSDYTQPSVFLLARTETAQYVASLCADNSIPLMHYEIGFFQEQEAKSFITQLAIDKTPTDADKKCVDSYYKLIQENITEEERRSFLGYAPVLQAIAAHIRLCPNRMKMISDFSNQKDCISIVMTIMNDLLGREQTEKVIPAFKEKCLEQHPEFTEWDKIYSAEEQLVRIMYYVLFGDTSFGCYSLDFLPSQLIDDYKYLLDTFLPQHPFVRNNIDNGDVKGGVDFTGPAFRDYTLAKIILSEDGDSAELAKLYFEKSQSKSLFSSQIFFDCYKVLSDSNVRSSHIAYVYDSFRAKATAMERPYLQCSEISKLEAKDNNYLAVFGMLSPKREPDKDDETIVMTLTVDNEEMVFEQMTNISVDMPNLVIRVGREGVESRITNSSIICREIIWATENITIESYAPEGCLLVARDKMKGKFPEIEIVRDDNLHVSAVNLNEFYRLIQYKYDLDDTSTFDITKFIHALRCLLMEFRTHKKDTLAKTADRIEFVTVGSSESKRKVLEYLKKSEIIFESAHLYKINEDKMKQKGIYFAALSRMDTDSLKPVYDDFCKQL